MPQSFATDVFNPFESAFRTNPYAVYSHFRTHDPVHWGTAPFPYESGCWYLTRYADNIAVLKDVRFVRRKPQSPNDVPLPLPDTMKSYVSMSNQWMLFRDPPDHTRLRMLVNKAFTPHVVEKLRIRVQALANELLDKVQSGGTMDVIANYAFPLPVTIIAELLGVPSNDREQWKRWSSALAAALDLNQSFEPIIRASQATDELKVFLHDLILDRKLHPQDDILSALISVEEQGDRLSEKELVATCILLLLAGHETTGNLIGNGVYLLLKNPDQLETLRQNPAMIQTAIEEFLRYESSIQMTMRYPAEDVELGGKRLKTGQPVMLVLGAANHDPAQFPDPDRLDIARADNRHMAFGSGIHFCVGAPLARLEGQIAIATLLQRMPALQLQNEAPDWNNLIAFRSLRSLLVSF